ncbi:Multidrug resistance protein NorM [termite gut metagenome]|uniref:Multidrug resistance protein NorM n=1 Tax=termite gut metagenome TaxID=433724 RepID=A0A5J4QST8_9ZZZZ
MPESNNDSAECGLMYANNEICYPATLIVGDLIKALKSGKYDISQTAVFLIMLFLFKHPIAGLFTDNEEVRVMVISLVFPMLLYQFGDGLQISFANALRGISDVKPMIWIAFIAYFVISLPVGYFFGFVLDWGIVGVWMAFPFGLTSAGGMLWYRFQRKQK